MSRVEGRELPNALDLRITDQIPRRNLCLQQLRGLLKLAAAEQEKSLQVMDDDVLGDKEADDAFCVVLSFLVRGVREHLFAVGSQLVVILATQLLLVVKNLSLVRLPLLELVALAAELINANLCNGLNVRHRVGNVGIVRS